MHIQEYSHRFKKRFTFFLSSFPFFFLHPKYQWLYKIPHLVRKAMLQTARVRFPVGTFSNLVLHHFKHNHRRHSEINAYHLNVTGIKAAGTWGLQLNSYLLYSPNRISVALDTGYIWDISYVVWKSGYIPGGQVAGAWGWPLTSIECWG